MSDNYLWIKETYVNKDKGYVYGETEPYETWAEPDEVDELFLSLQREFGRCVNTQYTEVERGVDVKSGWVFEKRVQYNDCDESYIKQTWVTVWSEAPVEVHRHWTGGKYAF